MMLVLSLACTLAAHDYNYNSHPFTFYLPFHTSPRADQCPIHAPSTRTVGLDPCARHSLFGRTGPYYTDNFYSYSSALLQHLPSPFSVIVLSSQYLFQRGPIWVSFDHPGRPLYYSVRTSPVVEPKNIPSVHPPPPAKKNVESEV